MAEDNTKITKRTRNGGQRSKTGCTTCRARHVRCDEKVPSCLNCTSSGRKCDGYEGARAALNRKNLSSLGIARLYTSKTGPWNDSRIALAPTLGLPSNEQGNHFFYSFLLDCVPSLTEALDSAFWKRAILRACWSPTVQHATIAFGAVYEQKVTSQNHHGSLASSSNSKRLEIVSSLRYGTAIQMLRNCIAGSPWTPEVIEEIMIACLIFIFMEILRGDDVAAVTHLDGALKLYSYAQSTSQAFIHDKESKVASDLDTTVEQLTKAFLRLDFQSTLYMGSRTPWNPDKAMVGHSSKDIPSTFTTFLSARDSLDAHLASIMSFVTPPKGAESCFPRWCPHPDRGFDIYTIFHGSTYRDYNMPKAPAQRRHFIHILSRWKSAFQAFLQKETPKTPEALAGCALLWLKYYTTRIKLAVSYTDDECSYDEHLPSFKKIIEQAQAYLKYTAHVSPSQLQVDSNVNLTGKAPSLKPMKKYFKVHSNVCYPLYYTVLKCRSKPVRQVSLEMLRNAESEGIWDAEMLARIAGYVVTVEEDSIELESHDVLPDAPHFGVSEANRIHCLSLNIDKVQRTVWLKCSRRSIEPQGEISHTSNPLKRWRIDNTILTWKDPVERVGSIEPRHSGLDLPPSATPPLENQTLLYRSPQTQC